MKKSDSIRHDSKPLALGLAALGLCTAALVACGGGGTDTGPSGPPADTSKQYVGFYQEDPGNNPEDPMPGTMIMRLPAGSGSFEGQMPFSYIGCQGGADVGTVSGTRTAQTLAGNWTGSVDGVAVGGSYNGTYSAPVDQFSGTYVNAGGKVPISGPGGCHYSVAAFGTWRLFGDSVHQPANFLIGSSHGTTPTWSWPSLGSGIYYIVRVFDQTCLNAKVTSTECLMGETQTVLQAVRYPVDFSSAKALVIGREYLIALHAVDSADFKQVGFSTQSELP